MALESAKKKSPVKICIVSYDVIGKNMAGPGIRFFEFAKVLSNYIDVTLLAPNRADIEAEKFDIKKYNPKNPGSLDRYLENSDILLIQGHLLYYFPVVKDFKGKIIVDLYNPFNLESLEMYKDENMVERIRIDKNNLNILKLQLTIGDFFICASEKQRDYWLGMLNAAGRINPYTYDPDNTLRSLIDVVSFGIPSEPPVRSARSIRDIIPSLKEDDKIILWGGGIWNWLDPITPVKALWEISRSRSDIKLIFMGIKHPDPKLPEMKKCLEAIQLSKELDLYDKNVFFNEWTPYELRQTLLLESDVGLSIHQEKIETEFSYRTRVLDYVWARLPIITTEGDSIAKMVKEENIGEIVKYEDAHQLARVMESMVVNKSLKDIYRKNLNKINSRFYWENVSKPLIRYCANPYYAEDKNKIVEMIDLQNSKISKIIKSNFEGCTNVLMVTSNRLKDNRIITGGDVGKVFLLEVNGDAEHIEDSGLDAVGVLKSKITQRTKFDGIIINNAYRRIGPRFFYDLVNVVGQKIKSEGLLFFSLPENRGLYNILGTGKRKSEMDDRIDDFTIEYILTNSGFKVVEKGELDEISKNNMAEGGGDFGNIYGKNELFELFEIGLDRGEFKKLKLLSRFDILKSKEFSTEKTVLGKMKKYMYLLTSMYFENLRKSYNESIKAINNNIQLQINREINELNRKNRERILLIYYNIFSALYHEIKGIGGDISDLRDIMNEIFKKNKKTDDSGKVSQKLEMILRDLSAIDRIMGLTISNKYYIAKKV